MLGSFSAVRPVMKAAQNPRQLNRLTEESIQWSDPSCLNRVSSLAQYWTRSPLPNINQCRWSILTARKQRTFAEGIPLAAVRRSDRTGGEGEGDGLTAIEICLPACLMVPVQCPALLYRVQSTEYQVQPATANRPVQRKVNASCTCVDQHLFLPSRRPMSQRIDEF